MQISAGFVRIGVGSRRFDRMAGWLFSVVFVVCLALRVCVAQQSTILVGSGSTVPLPLYAKWAEQYNRHNPKMQMRYLPIGASEGIREILHGSGDFGAGEVPLTAKERADGNLIELPSVLIAMVPIYNLPGVQGEMRFSGEVLADFPGTNKNVELASHRPAQSKSLLAGLADQGDLPSAGQRIELRFQRFPVQEQFPVPGGDWKEPISGVAGWDTCRAQFRYGRKGEK